MEVIVFAACIVSVSSYDGTLAQQLTPKQVAPMPPEPGELRLQPPLLLNQDGPPLPLLIAGRAAGVLVGATASALVHELGHAVLAWGYGYKFVWPTGGGSEPFMPYWRLERPDGRPVSPEHKRNVATGGFIISMALEEIILNSRRFPKSDVFVGGFAFYSLLNNVTYVVTDLLAVSRGRAGVGDIRDIVCARCRDWGVPRGVLYTVLIAHSALAVARILKDPGFLSWSFWSEGYVAEP